MTNLQSLINTIAKNARERLELFVRTSPIDLDEKFVVWLITNGFFDAPASTIHHGAYAGGLFDHSYEVTKHLQMLTSKLNLEWQDKRSPWLIGMFHDLCKIDNYILKDGVYEKNQHMVLTGHAQKSIVILNDWINLTDEETACIRCHMGAYIKEDWDLINILVKRYPNVLYTQTADMYASHVKGI